MSQKTENHDQRTHQKKKKLGINFGARRRNEEAKTCDSRETDTCAQETDKCDQKIDKYQDNEYIDNEKQCEAPPHIPAKREVRPCSAVVTSSQPGKCFGRITSQ